MAYRLAVFDMDGTILNTIDDLTDATNHALKACGYPTHTVDEVRFFVGNGIAKLIERATPQGTSEEERAKVRAAFMDYYSVHSADKTGPYDGIGELLQRLRAAGVKTAVVSNKPDVAVRDLVVKYFDGLFDAAVGDMVGQRTKPAPDMCMKVFDKLGIGPEDAVYIGDSDTDIQTARNAGTDEILVSWGFRGRAFLEEHDAKCICDTTDEVYDIIVAK
ncbi:MAG: HAD-IA family hydrolase [Lachnospiraceae bacterium]|nr:HAD-IA family hydrolase [Lachnospiraceae bacterium]